jgi:hypothetical protein
MCDAHFLRHFQAPGKSPSTTAKPTPVSGWRITALRAERVEQMMTSLSSSPSQSIY